MEPEINSQNIPSEHKKRKLAVLFILAVLIIGAFWAVGHYSNFSSKQGVDFSVFASWPVEKENIINNFSSIVSQPTDTEYRIVYQSSKSFSDVLNDYQKAFQDKKLVFRQVDNSNPKTKFFSRTFSTNLENENATLSVKVDMIDKVLVTLFYTKYNSGYKVKALPAIAPMTRINIPNLALPLGFPANFPLPIGAKITESYNLVNNENSKPTQASITLISSQSLDEIKNFFISNLKVPEYKFSPDSNKADTDSKKTLVFSDKLGILIIRITKETGGTSISINQSNLIP